MTSTASFGGRRDRVGGVTPGGPRITPPVGDGRSEGGSRVVDGRGTGPGMARGEGHASSGLYETCVGICNTLKSCKVNFVALDFDLTIVDIHTAGRWPGTPEQLAQRIRPFFNTLIPVAIAQGLYLGVVTFSPQVTMIRRVLKAAFPDIATQIPVRGDDFTWGYKGRGVTDGKQSHMASAVEELTQTHAASITRASTILIDDDVNNVQIALGAGVKAVWCNPKDSSSMVSELVSLGEPRDREGSMEPGRGCSGYGSVAEDDDDDDEDEDDHMYSHTARRGPDASVL